eukprot:gene33807-40907_t
MFDPAKTSKNKAEKAAKKKALEELKTWAMECVPEDLRQDLIIDVSEVVCGDPSCAPIDTFVQFVWATSGKGMFAIPEAAANIPKEDFVQNFPDRETLQQWREGKKARWPPLPALRFQVGDRVECRIGPHPVKGWAPGRIIKLYYSEPNWPPNMIVPYQIALHDGRLIFAPQDTDQVIRLRPPPAPDAPSSPEYVARDYEEDDGEYEDYEDEGEMDEGEEDDGEDDDGQGGLAHMK